MNDVNKAPKVTVCVVTYNQEKYIRQCLQSIVDQETDFRFEVLVSDDCSTDETQSIIKHYAESYPEIIKPIYQEKNIGAFHNFKYVHELATTEYVAHIDGDDFMLPNKLQVQYDFMKLNPKCVILWHRMLISDEMSGVSKPQHYRFGELDPIKFDVDSFLSFVTLGIHSSKMYKRKLHDIKETPHFPIDFSENVLHLNNEGGYAAFLQTQEAYGVYRKSVGISRSTGAIRKIIYSWYGYFYSNNIGSKKIIASKLFLMIASDLRRGLSSAYTGFFILMKMWRYISPATIKILRANRIEKMISMSTDN